MDDGKRADVLQGVAHLVAPAPSPDQERGLADAIDEADQNALVDGATVFANLRALLRDAG
jgi:hypothetical protein